MQNISCNVLDIGYTPDGTRGRKGRKMIRKLMHRVTHRHVASEFESYVSGLQSGGAAGRPTADEAKRDYQAVLRRKTLAS